MPIQINRLIRAAVEWWTKPISQVFTACPLRLEGETQERSPVAPLRLREMFVGCSSHPLSMMINRIRLLKSSISIICSLWSIHHSFSSFFSNLIYFSFWNCANTLVWRVNTTYLLRWACNCLKKPSMNFAPKTSFQGVSEFNQCPPETSPELEQWGANWWQVSDGQRGQCSLVAGSATAEVTWKSKVFFFFGIFFPSLPGTFLKHDQKTLWTLLNTAFAGGMRQHTWL